MSRAVTGLGGRSLPSVVQLSSASCAWSCRRATAASEVDRFSRSLLPYTSLCQTHRLKHGWMKSIWQLAVLSNFVDYVVIHQFSDHHHHSRQAALSFLTRRHLSFSQDRSTTSSSSHHVPHVYTPKVVPTCATCANKVPNLLLLWWRNQEVELVVFNICVTE